MLWHSRTGLWRLAALALLLCGTFDLLAVDTGLWNACGGNACCDDSPSNEDCYCCCAHVLVIPYITVDPASISVGFVGPEPSFLASVPARVPDLPPRV
jgi:hypothetical protein